MNRNGIDYSSAPALDVDALRGAGVSFVLRYASHDPHKNLTPAEARTLGQGGIDIGVVWEATAGEALRGSAVGAASATLARRQAVDCGMPAGRPIYFAVDFDASAAQLPAIDEYLRGAASVLGPHGVGVYGSAAVVDHCVTSGAAAWAWQTYAWSHGRLSTHAHLFQHLNGTVVAGIPCDLDTALHADFGQWRPTQEAVTFPFGADEYLGTARPNPRCHWGATPADREAVAHWQARLHERGWALPVTGVFGKQSERVCRSFQAEKGLHADGLVGPATWQASWTAAVTAAPPHAAVATH